MSNDCCHDMAACLAVEQARAEKAERLVDRALALTDEELGCTDWCRGEHCLFVIKTFREALAE